MAHLAARRAPYGGYKCRGNNEADCGGSGNVMDLAPSLPRVGFHSSYTFAML